MEPVDHRTVAFFAILTPRTIKELAAPSMDGVVTRLLIVGPAAKVDVMAQPAVVGAAPERLLQLQRRLELKSLCWGRLRVRLRMAPSPRMGLVARGMEILFVEIGQMVLAVLFTG